MAGLRFPHVLLRLLAFTSLAACSPRAAITPFAAPPLLPRQDLVQTCGYVDANILSPIGCLAGSTCAADVTQSVAGICCRLGNNANCVAVTSCVASANLQASCNGDCSSNAAVTKCSDVATPYCYTRYWVSADRTPVEIGCTTTQGYSAFVYTTYTGLGGSANFDPATTPPPSTTPVGTGTAVQTGSSTSTTSGGGGGASSSSDQSSGDSTSNSVSNSGGSGSSTPVGAIAGGVVGGVVGLGLIAAVIVWIVLRHRRKSREAAWSQGGGNAATSAPAGGGQEKPPKSAVAATSPVSPNAPTRGQNPGANQTHEIAPNDRQYELHDRDRVPELP